MKKKIIALSLAVILLSSLGAGTLAYFTAEDVAHNVITSGGVDIKLVEQMLASDGTTRIPFENQSGLLPGHTASKIVFVENLEEEAWIRVKVEKTVLAADQKTKLDSKYITMNFSDDWLEADGYYYYKKPVSTGKATTDLFTQVTFDGPGMDNAYQSCSVGISIYAQAVQTAHNPEEPIAELTAGNLAQVKGWPSPVEEAIAKIFG